MKKIKKILYGLRLLADIFFLVLLIPMLPYIYQSSWQGFLFLGVTFIYTGMTLWTLLSKREVYKNTLSYNLIMIFVFLYFALITSRILLDTRLQLSDLYTINIAYCKNNFFLLSLILIGMFCNTILLALAEDEEITLKKQRKKITEG